MSIDVQHLASPGRPALAERSVLSIIDKFVASGVRTCSEVSWRHEQIEWRTKFTLRRKSG
jgi:hypothetical protein